MALFAALWEKYEVYFCWVPAFVGIKGNEGAGVAAKEAVNLASVSRIPIPSGVMRGPIHSSAHKKWQDHWSVLKDSELRAIQPSIFHSYVIEGFANPLKCDPYFHKVCQIQNYCRPTHNITETPA